MPTCGWNGKLMMGGCGGACGNYVVDRVDPALVRGQAVVTTDMGHQGSGWMWAWNNLEAQRVPTDFEGIVAGAPVWSQTGNHPFFTHWGERVNIGNDGRTILDAAKLPMIHDAVLAACDARDGLRDGIPQDPRQCDWNPQSIRCAAGVVRRIYEGARNSKGDLLYAGMARGSEDQWAGIWISGGGQPVLLLGGPGFIANSLTAYMTFMRDGGPGYSVFRDFDYDRDPPWLALIEGFFSPRQHDLRPFKAAGGKMLLWTGWNDNNIPPAAAIDYYETTTRTMGGTPETRDFFRMFLLPAVNHCSGGLAGSEVDWIGVLEDWVERGSAPDAVLHHHPVAPVAMLAAGSSHDPGTSYMVYGRHPLAPGSFDRVRPATY